MKGIVRGGSRIWFAVTVLVWFGLICATQAQKPRRIPTLPDAPERGGFDISLDQADVRHFVKMIGEITQKRFVVGEGVEGKVTIVAPRIKKEEAYPLFLRILESAGCSVVQDGDLYRVIPLPKRETPSAPVVKPGDTPPEGGLVTRIFRLNYVSPAELRKALESTVGGGKTGAISAIQETGHLLVTDTVSTVRRIEQIIEEIDKPGLARTMEIVKLKFAGADDLADQLNKAMAVSLERGAKIMARLPNVPGYVERRPQDSRQAVVVASPHSNSLIIVGTKAQIEELRNIISKMDIESSAGRGRLNAIFLEYIPAEEAAKSLTSLMTKVDKASGSSSRRREIAVEASKAINALIVDASPGDFDEVQKLVQQLDQVPEQVHVEVLILELSASAGLDLGVELRSLEIPSEIGDTKVQGSLSLDEGVNDLLNNLQAGAFPAGITVGVAHGTRLDASGNIESGYPGVLNINALKRDGKARIQMETSLGVQNNTEAEVTSVNEIPVLDSTIQGTGADRDVIQNIKRVEVGMRLKLTPHIIPGGKVRMVLNPSLEAVIDQGRGGVAYTPTIARRQVSTTVTVPDGETIVIAGLTRNDTRKTVRKVPILGSIPLVGLLFRRTVDTVDKTNVLILVTPHILSEKSDADTVSKRWQEKTGLHIDEARNTE